MRKYLFLRILKRGGETKGGRRDLTTGLRNAEICSLKVVDLKTYRNQAAIDVIGKGKKFRRTPSPSGTLLVIKDYLKAAGNGTNPGDPLFRTLGKHGPYQ